MTFRYHVYHWSLNHGGTVFGHYTLCQMIVAAQTLLTSPKHNWNPVHCDWHPCCLRTSEGFLNNKAICFEYI